MLEGLFERYNKIEIDEGDKRYQYLSNYNRFQAAKDQGYITTDLATLLAFLKYERTHNNRQLVLRRLFSLAMSEYRIQAWNELVGGNNDVA